jgi:ribosomal protein S18 acetylase RimI-like enzyme
VSDHHADPESGPESEAVAVEPAATVDDELVAAFERLIPQLSSSSPPPGRAQLADIVGNPSTVLFVARAGGLIVGSLTLAFYRIPTGLKAWIEDVVVDDAVRGRGVGAALNQAALAEARQRGAKDVSLTSRPSRDAANRLYLRLGFVARDTNMYRYTF